MSRLRIEPTKSNPITRDEVAAYGDAVGDHNPVHFDPAFAKAMGLADTVVHGPLTTAIIVDRLIAQFGADNILNLDVRLRGPVFPGDQLSMTPIDYGEQDRGVEVHNQRGERIATVTTILKGDADG
ncbi:MAG: acyl dehydratase [Alphaproteobacteria bacterium]|nr:acyl dehydratase [Alphaproteobacteria bacterium]